jgi:hypothetical protein
MTENEIMLIEAIRNHPNPENAIVIAIEIISNFLKQSESFE